LPSKLTTIAGVDVSYEGEIGIGAVTVLSYSFLEILTYATANFKVNMPYIPTSLSFRELPPAIAAIKQLKVQPDVFLVDAHGLAHPYRFGFACHLGLVLGKPTIGVAKSRLIGEVLEKDGRMLLVDNNDIVREAVNTSDGAKSVYVSVRHMISLETAVRIVKHCSRSRIPEPTLRAHRLAAGQKTCFSIK
jgi:deoxyribonuclease V